MKGAGDSAAFAAQTCGMGVRVLGKGWAAAEGFVILHTRTAAAH